MTGLPKHSLVLKIGVPIMLLRNLSGKDSMCNGTRLIVTGFVNNRLIIAQNIATGKTVLIPRIPLRTNPGDFPFGWTRLQFPVRLAFAMTINKSQGQTLKKASVFLPVPVFSHGQFYVVASRVRAKEDIKFFFTERNIYM